MQPCHPSNSNIRKVQVPSAFLSLLIALHLSSFYSKFLCSPCKQIGTKFFKCLKFSSTSKFFNLFIIYIMSCTLTLVVATPLQQRSLQPLMKPQELESPKSSTPTATRWPFFVFLGGSMFCLLSSSICHLFICHSRRMKLFLLRIDYSGIAVMIVASFFPPVYYNFQCDPRWQVIYLTAMVSMGIFAIVTLLSTTSVSSGGFRAFRSMLFIAMGLSGVVPAIHALFLNWGEPKCSITLGYEVAMALSYITGALFYVSRVPERWKPGSFDLVGHSHQIFHVFVIAGALVHYAATLLFLEWRDRVGCKPQ